MSKYTKAQQTEAIDKLREWLKPGDTLYTIVRHVARSGMSRTISVYLMQDGKPFDVSYWVSRVIDDPIDQNTGGVKVAGCGMDMGFHVVYVVSSVLFPDGFMCIGKYCPSNDHTNGDRNYEPHQHKSGGYALNQRWM